MFLHLCFLTSLLAGGLSAQTHSNSGVPVTHIDESHARDLNGTIYYPAGDGTYIAPDGSTISRPSERSSQSSRSTRPLVSMDGWVIGGPLFYGEPWGPVQDERECFFRSEEGTNCSLYRKDDKFGSPTMMGVPCSRKVAENSTMLGYMNRLCHSRWLPEFRNIADAEGDEDGDGIPNKSDFCGGTPQKEPVWRFGPWTGCMGGQRPERSVW